MNGARHFNGRIEKRLPTLVPVYLASLQEPRSRERTLTESASPHGARVISQRFWQSGEESLITPLTGEVREVGRVVYCSPTAGDRLCGGVAFADHPVTWGEHSSD